jgi:hypothetical protein
MFRSSVNPGTPPVTNAPPNTGSTGGSAPVDLNLSVETWIRFVVWMALGFVIYFTYSRNHSLLATGEKFEEGEVPFEGGRVV